MVHLSDKIMPALRNAQSYFSINFSGQSAQIYLFGRLVFSVDEPSKIAMGFPVEMIRYFKKLDCPVSDNGKSKFWEDYQTLDKGFSDLGYKVQTREEFLYEQREKKESASPSR